MPKTLSSIVLAVVLFTRVVIAGVLFPLPHQSKEPPGADDTGSTEQGVMDIATANNRFAFDLYFQLDKSEHRNLFYSPYGISAALAMTYEGANGRTADEMKSVFHFPESRILRPNFAAIHNAINKGANDYELRTGNALWVQRDFPLLEDYQSRYVKVDEKGTEAAAATAVGATVASVMRRKVFRADHPFIFIIQQKDTGSILFLGRVVDPTK